VSNWDEDAVTMSVEAARRCLAGIDTDGIDTVIVASTTFPYAEKQCAALVAEALDLPRSVDTMDVASSVRAGTQALRIAADRVEATGKRVLVVAADQRGAAAEDAAETTIGDAAAAVLLGPEGSARIRWVSVGYQTWLSHWRLAGERYGHDADGRFVSTMTVASLKDALGTAVQAAAERGATVSAVAVAAPNVRDAVRAAAGAGLPDGVRVIGPALQGDIGYAGAAAPLLALAAALDGASTGDVLVWASTGDGAEAALVDVDDGDRFSSSVADAVGAGVDLTYARYLRIREVLPDAALSPFSSEIEQWRDADRTARLQAARCRACGHIAYPPQPVCSACHRHDDAEAYSLPRTGRLFTFTVEHLFPNPERRLAMGVLELEDGVRFYAAITDVPPEDLYVGMPMRLVYRRLHLGGQFVNYFWKATRAVEEVTA
jgi:3-hydroxy-3-methylglutaryl CoA synthase/uncharacterized OB-fold protein